MCIVAYFVWSIPPATRGRKRRERLTRIYPALPFLFIWKMKSKEFRTVTPKISLTWTHHVERELSLPLFLYNKQKTLRNTEDVPGKKNTQGNKNSKDQRSTGLFTNICEEEPVILLSVLMTPDCDKEKIRVMLSLGGAAGCFFTLQFGGSMT